MQSALADDPLSTGDIWRCFPRWINTHYRALNGNTFEAVEQSDQEPPELAVVMWAGCVPVATYKCRVVSIAGPGDGWIVLAPLVVVWGGSRSTNGFEAGRVMIDHICAAARRFHRAHGTYDRGLMVASGNLTEEKGGERFFDALGWEIATPRERQPASIYQDEPALLPALAATERLIEEALAPLRRLRKADEPVRFAFLPLR